MSVFIGKTLLIWNPLVFEIKSFKSTTFNTHIVFNQWMYMYMNIKCMDIWKVFKLLFIKQKSSRYQKSEVLLTYFNIQHTITLNVLTLLNVIDWQPCHLAKTVIHIRCRIAECNLYTCTWKLTDSLTPLNCMTRGTPSFLWENTSTSKWLAFVIVCSQTYGANSQI